MDVPHSFEVSFGLLEPALVAVESRVGAIMHNWAAAQDGLLVQTRIKRPQSVYSKLAKGGYADVLGLQDLVGVRLTGSTSAFYEDALAFISERFQVKLPMDGRVMPPDRLAHECGKVVVRLPHDEFFEEQPDPWRRVSIEIQLTTALAAAVDAAAHGFVYKAGTLSWRRQRLMAELRGLVNLAELMLAKPDVLESLATERSYPPYDQLNAISSACETVFGSQAMPDDARRMALTVERLLHAADVDPSDLVALAQRSPDIVNLASLTVVDKVLGLLICDLDESEVRKFTASACKYQHSEALTVPLELEDVCPSAAHIPAELRVRFDFD